MTRKIAPSAQKAQELAPWLAGQNDVQSGEEVLRALIRLSTERVRQEALEQAQPEALGRSRYTNGSRPPQAIAMAMRTARARPPTGSAGCSFPKCVGCESRIAPSCGRHAGGRAMC